MRGSVRFFLGTAVVISGAASAAAQDVTIQLPNFSTFGVNTTVVVPDSGAAPLASERQAFYSRYSPLGFPRSRAYGAQRRAAGVSVSATVHDAAQADRELLLQARARRTNWKRGSTTGKLPHQPHAADPALRSVAELERERAAAEDAAGREARALVEKAREARAAGKASVAAVYYRMAARLSAGAARQKIEAEARELAASR